MEVTASQKEGVGSVFDVDIESLSRLCSEQVVCMVLGALPSVEVAVEEWNWSVYCSADIDSCLVLGNRLKCM